MSETMTASAPVPTAASDESVAWSLAVHLLAIVNRLRSRVDELEADNRRLRDRLGELEHSAALDSDNSSKPPSSDGLKKADKSKKRTASLRKKSGRKKGGQAGHKGHTLRQVDHADEVIDHYPNHCKQCDNALSRDSDSYVCRQVFDLPEPVALEVTEHRAHQVICKACHTVTRAVFPLLVKAPVQYGERLSAVVSYLHHAQFIPVERVAQSLKDLFAVSLSTGTVAAMCTRTAERVKPLAGVIAEIIRLQAPIKHLDETGLRVAGKLRWVHVLSTKMLTALRLGESRGDVGTGYTGIAVHDEYSSYFAKLKDVIHALCNAHHLRELTAVEQIDRESWAKRMRRLLERAWRIKHQAQEQGLEPSAQQIRIISMLWDRILTDAIAFHEAQPPLKSAGRGRKKRRKGHNLALRLQRNKDACLRFLNIAIVPFSNNQGETDFRFVKLFQKIFGGFRTETGAENHLTVRCIIGTARKQGWNIIEVIMHPNPVNLKDKLRF